MTNNQSDTPTPSCYATFRDGKMDYSEFCVSENLGDFDVSELDADIDIVPLYSEAIVSELLAALSAERAKNAAVIAEATGYRDRVTELEKEVANLRDGSELWDALIGCARIRVYGTAGLGECGELKDESNYAHIGAELWTMHGATTDDYSRACFVSFAQAARELCAMKGTP